MVCCDQYGGGGKDRYGMIKGWLYFWKFYFGIFLFFLLVCINGEKIDIIMISMVYGIEGWY